MKFVSGGASGCWLVPAFNIAFKTFLVVKMAIG